MQPQFMQGPLAQNYYNGGSLMDEDQTGDYYIARDILGVWRLFNKTIARYSKDRTTRF